MTIVEAIKIFEKLISRTENKRMRKTYETFIAILTDLNSKNLSENELSSLEKELEKLEVDGFHENSAKHFRKALEQLKNFLKESMSLIADGYYAGLGMALGMTFGVAIGTSIGSVIGLPEWFTSGITSGMFGGMFIGLLIGQSMDAKAKKEGKVYKVK